MKRKTAVLLSLILVLALLLTTLLFYVNGYGTTWDVKSDMYFLLDRQYHSGQNYNKDMMDETDLNGNSMYWFTVNTNFTDMNVLTMHWFPTFTVNSTTSFCFYGNTQKSFIDFELDESTRFGDFNGYNGAVSIAWYISANNDYWNNSGIPSTLHYTNYKYRDRKVTEEDEGIGTNGSPVIHFNNFYEMAGGLGPEIAKSDNTTGVVFTMFPSNDGADANTRNVSHFRLFVRKTPNELTDSQIPEVYNNDYEIYEGHFDSALDLSQKTRIELQRVKINNTDSAILLRIAQDKNNNGIDLKDYTTLKYKKLTREAYGYYYVNGNLIRDYSVTESDDYYWSVALNPQTTDFAYDDTCQLSLSITAAYDCQPKINLYDCG